MIANSVGFQKTIFQGLENKFSSQSISVQVYFFDIQDNQ